MEKETFATWEVEHEQQQTNEEWLEKLSRRQDLTRGQWWHGFGRRVTVPNSEARKVITTMAGRTLFLFDESQLQEQE